MLGYQSGFGNEFATEAVAGALPSGAECAAAGAVRTLCRTTQRDALHRAACAESALVGLSHSSQRHARAVSPDCQWLASLDAVRRGAGTAQSTALESRADAGQADGFSRRPASLLAGNGDLAAHSGVAIHVYVANRSMEALYCYNADGELLLVPQMGRLLIHTELGRIARRTGRNRAHSARDQVSRGTLEGEARGYICENYGAIFRLPELGPIGANCLANSRDFQTPVAAFEDIESERSVICKFQGNLWESEVRSFAVGRGGLAWQLRSL